MIDWDVACKLAETAATKAGEYIRAQRGQSFNIEKKSGTRSLSAQVVTEVDRQSETIISAILKPFMTAYGVGLLGEESGDDGSRLTKEYFWCIDPLDGTLAFIEGHAGVSVAIALVRQDGVVMVGVVYDLDTRGLYRSIRGQGAYLNDCRLYAKSGATFTWMEDRSHRDHPQYERIKKQIQCYMQTESVELSKCENNAGAVMNACWAIQQSHSVYFKLPKDKEGGGSLWDFAASACIFGEAGGFVSDINGGALALNRKESTFLNHKGVVFCTNKKWLNLLNSIQKELVSK